MFAPHSCHSNKEYGGVLWNPKVFRRFLPEQFTRKMSDEVYVDILKANGYVPCDIIPIIEREGEGYYKTIKKIVSLTYTHEASVIMTPQYKKLNKAYDEVASGNDEEALRILTTLTGEQNSAYESWHRAENLLKTIKKQVNNSADVTLKTSLVGLDSMNRLIYSHINNMFYIHKVHQVHRRYDSIKDFTGLVPDEYINLFNMIGDPSDPEVYGKPFHYWRAGLFYTLINHEIFVNGLSFEETIDKARALLDRIDYSDMNMLIDVCHEYATTIRKH